MQKIGQEDSVFNIEIRYVNGQTTVLSCPEAEALATVSRVQQRMSADGIAGVLAWEV